MKQVLLAGLVCLGFCFHLTATSASAGMIASQPLDFDTPFAGYFSEFNGQQIAEDFIVTAAATVNEVTWWGRSSGGARAFDILFFQDVAGVPDVTAFYSYTTPVLAGTFVGNDPFEQTATSIWNTAIPDVMLASPGTYWLNIRSSAGEPSFIWQHATAPGAGYYVRYSNNESWTKATWDPERNEMAFVLENNVAVVPEPSTFVLIGTGGIGLAGYGWRRKRRQWT